MNATPQKRPERLKPGDRVRVRQQMPQTDDCWTTKVEGTLVSHRQEPTGAWYAHGKDDKLWLDRAEVRTDDGELVDCILDRYSRIEVVEPAPRAEPVDEGRTRRTRWAP